MKDKNNLATGTVDAGQPTEQARNDYDLSWLLNIRDNGFPLGGIIDRPPNVFSHHKQFEEIGRNIVDPSRDAGITQTLAKEIAVVLLAKRFPGLAAVARPMVDTAVKAIEVPPAPAQNQQAAPSTNLLPAHRNPDQKEIRTRQDRNTPVRKKGKGLR